MTKKAEDTSKDTGKNTKSKEAKKVEETTEELKKRVGAGKEVVVAVLDKMNTLFTSGMGLVAALAWNEAVKEVFDKIFADQNKGSTWAKFGYAVVVTIIIVAVTYRLTKLIEKIKEDSGVELEKDKKKKKSEE